MDTRESESDSERTTTQHLSVQEQQEVGGMEKAQHSKSQQLTLPVYSEPDPPPPPEPPDLDLRVTNDRVEQAPETLATGTGSHALHSFPPFASPLLHQADPDRIALPARARSHSLDKFANHAQENRVFFYFETNSMENSLHMHNHSKSVGELCSDIENESINNPTEIPHAHDLNSIPTLSINSDRIELHENRIVTELNSAHEMNSALGARDFLKSVPGMQSNLLSDMNAAPLVENAQSFITQKRKRVIESSVEFSLMISSQNNRNSNIQSQNSRTRSIPSTVDARDNFEPNGNGTVTVTEQVYDNPNDPIFGQLRFSAALQQPSAGNFANAGPGQPLGSPVPRVRRDLTSLGGVTDSTRVGLAPPIPARPSPTSEQSLQPSSQSPPRVANAVQRVRPVSSSREANSASNISFPKNQQIVTTPQQLLILDGGSEADQSERLESDSLHPLAVFEQELRTSSSSHLLTLANFGNTSVLLNTLPIFDRISSAGPSEPSAVELNVAIGPPGSALSSCPTEVLPDQILSNSAGSAEHRRNSTQISNSDKVTSASQSKCSAFEQNILAGPPESNLPTTEDLSRSAQVFTISAGPSEVLQKNHIGNLDLLEIFSAGHEHQRYIGPSTAAPTGPLPTTEELFPSAIPKSVSAGDPFGVGVVRADTRQISTSPPITSSHPEPQSTAPPNFRDQITPIYAFAARSDSSEFDGEVFNIAAQCALRAAGHQGFDRFSSPNTHSTPRDRMSESHIIEPESDQQQRVTFGPSAAVDQSATSSTAHPTLESELSSVIRPDSNQHVMQSQLKSTVVDELATPIAIDLRTRIQQNSLVKFIRNSARKLCLSV